ncbi:MAG: hypothetical protein AMXMBFR58_12160 [Phycisphaerae bacterium]|nr:hypothetical protein [Phycisphaerales bacterium]MCK6475427.1 hypothetical protein [Phycisphaerales bacterium]
MSGNVMKLAAVMIAAVGVLAGGCESEKKADTKAAPAVMNANCPFSNHPVSPDATATYHGKTVGFCCKDCADKWGKMTDAERDAALAKMPK